MEKKFKKIKSWNIKVEDLDESIELFFNSLPGDNKIKLREFSNHSIDIGRTMSLAGGEVIVKNFFNRFVTFGLWLRENNLVEINKKPKPKKEERKESTYFG